MKKLISITLIFLGLQACSSVLFTESQPENAETLTEFPEKIIGTFTHMEDTLVIAPTSFVYAGGDVITISGDLTPPPAVLKKMDGWYFINLQEDNEWWIYPFQISGKDKISVYYSDMNEKEQGIVERFRKDLKVKEIYKNDTLDYYLISPTKPQFKKLLKEGLFSKKMVFSRIR